MSDLSKLRISGTDYNLKDAQARSDITALNGSLQDIEDEVRSGTESIFTDLSLWNRGYIDASGTLVNNVRTLSPSSAPIKLDKGKTVHINTGSLVCWLGIFKYNEDTQTYSRTQNTSGFSGDFSVVSNSDNYYYTLTFKFDPQGSITPSDFDGRIYEVLEWRLQVDNCISQVDALPDTNGLVYAYNDLSAWNNGYFGSDGIVASSPSIITPISEPIKMLAGDTLVINPDALVLKVATYNYLNGRYTRQSSTDYTEITTITFDTETYITFQFSKNPSGAVTPSEFTGYIKAQTTWLNKIHDNTARIVMLENASASGNYLSGKKLVACGDSITAAANPSGGHFDSYAKLTAMRNGMEFEVNAVSGSTMTNVTGKNPFCVDRYQQIPEDADYITIWFGYNDGAYAQVGTINDTEDTTFYGAYKKVLDYLVSQYPTKKIGIIVPYMSDTTFQVAVRNISEMYGIPCLDLPNGNQCSCVWGDANSVQTARKSALTYDNTHPNQDGHEFISTMYEAFLRRL